MTLLQNCCDMTDGDFRAVSKRLLHAKSVCAELHFIGNGGSAAIASHMAIDFMNKGEFITHDYNNPAALTCLANDYGYEEVFAKQIRHRYAAHDDVLVAISSSGESENIVLAIRAARNIGMDVVTFTGFSPGNRVHSMGQYGFHVPSTSYGEVETCHLGILHALLEDICQ